MTAFCGLGVAAVPALPNGLYARVQTSRGLIVIRLYPDRAPIAVANFVGLAEATIANAALDPGQPFFDGSTFHRVVPGHVIQTGIPKSTRSRGPGYSFPNEIDARLSHNHAGAVNMANSGPGTNGSQWCITLGDRSYLDGDFTVFGDVVEGLDTVLAIHQGDGLASVRIERIGIKAQSYHPTTATFQAMVAAAKQRAAQELVLKRQAEEAWIQAHYPHATGTPGGVLTQSLAPAPTASAAAAGPLEVRYSGRELRYVGDWAGHSGPPIHPIAFGSNEKGLPVFGDPQVFSYQPGASQLNPGLDSVLASLHPGDRRIVIVPAAQGFGRSGLYPPEIHGQPRFVVSPNALLVYDVEVMTRKEQQ